MSDKGKNDELLVMIILKRHDIAFSLILVPTKSELRGFCLLIFIDILFDYRQKNPLKCYVVPPMQGREK